MRLLDIAVLAGCASAGLTTVAETPSWYVTTSIGYGQKSGMDQVGSNRDTFCYPTEACFLETPVPRVPGYRWRYAIDLDAGSGFELGVGRELDNWRFELTAVSAAHDTTQTFTAIEYLDGSPLLPGDGTVFADIEATIDHVATATFALSVSRKASVGRMNAYFGAGAGRALVVVRGLRFRANYRSDSAAQFDPPLSFYDSRQHDDLFTYTLHMLIHVGAEYPLNDRIHLGARLTYSHVGDIRDRSSYRDHPMHGEQDSFTDFKNENTFDAASGWQVSATFRYRLGRR